MKTCAICIAAYDCVEFLPDLLRSIKNQQLLNGWIYDYRIGVDGCRKTSDFLRKMGVKHYYSTENVGHLVMRNSLFYLAPAHVYAYFDADDYMLPTYLAKNIATADYHNFVMAKKINVNAELMDVRRRGPVIENGGAMTFTSRVLEAVGGFAPYRCAGDTDLMRRAEMAGFNIHVIDEALYLRRSHHKALTKAEHTRIKSPYRTRVWKEMCDARAKGRIRVSPVMTELVEVN